MHDLEFIRRSPGISGDLRGSPGIAPDQVSESAAQTLPSTRAGGQDDGSYTNSLKRNVNKMCTACVQHAYGMCTKCVLEEKLSRREIKEDVLYTINIHTISAQAAHFVFLFPM